MDTYQITVGNLFDAESPQEAMLQTVAWLLDNATTAAYRVTNLRTGESAFIDAEGIAE